MICNLKTGLFRLSKLKHRSQLVKCISKLTFYLYRYLQSLLSLYFSTSTSAHLVYFVAQYSQAILPSIKVLTGEPTITVTHVRTHTHTNVTYKTQLLFLRYIAISHIHTHTQTVRYFNLDSTHTLLHQFHIPKSHADIGHN